MKKPGIFAIIFIPIFFCCFELNAQAASNDECTGAIILPINENSSCDTTRSGSTGNCTESFPNCISSGFPAKDAWYKFVATSTVHRVTVNPTNGNNFAFQIYSESCTALISIACVNSSNNTGEPDVTVLQNLTIGSTYYIRVWDYYGGSSNGNTFKICINTSSDLLNNDNCINAQEVIPSSTTTYGTIVTSHNFGATQSMPGCFGTAEDDVWFKFTAINARHRIKVSTNEGMSPVLEVFSGSCGALNSIMCRYTGNGGSFYFVDVDIYNLIPGNIYIYRVYGSSGNNIRTNITTNIITLAAPVSNDECAGAIILPINENSSCDTSRSGNTGNCTQSFPSCVATGFDAKDVWYKFVATSTVHRVTVTPANGGNFISEVYKGSCTGLVSVACVNSSNGSGEPDVTVLQNLVVGNTYYLRVWEYFGVSSPGYIFKICINTSSSLLNNDDCNNALEVLPSSSTAYGGSVTCHNFGATQSMAGCSGTAEDDVWFKFTATNARHRIMVNTNENMFPEFEVFNGSCGALNSISCRYPGNGGSKDYIDAELYNLIPGNLYFYRVYGNSGSNVRTNISTYIITLPDPPLNDECTGAISIPVSNNSSCDTSWNGTIGYSSQSFPSCALSGLDAKDVWYKFVPTSTTHKITLTPTNGTSLAFQIYSGNCGGLVSVACVNTSNDFQAQEITILSNLIIGNTYYIRVWDYYGGSSIYRTFKICINNPSSQVSNDECSNALLVTASADANRGPITTSSNAGATQSMPGCSGSAEDDVWFKFIATNTRNKIIVNTDGAISPVLEVFNGLCNSLNSIRCRYPGNGGSNNYVEADLTDLVSGNTYYYRVYGNASTTAVTNISTNIITLPSIVTGVSNLEFSDYFKVFPNPITNGKLIIESKKPLKGNIYILIHNQTGALIEKILIGKNLNKFKREIFLNGLSDGNYIVTLKSDEGTSSVKVLNLH